MQNFHKKSLECLTPLLVLAALVVVAGAQASGAQLRFESPTYYQPSYAIRVAFDVKSRPATIAEVRLNGAPLGGALVFGDGKLADRSKPLDPGRYEILLDYAWASAKTYTVTVYHQEKGPALSGDKLGKPLKTPRLVLQFHPKSGQILTIEYPEEQVKLWNKAGVIHWNPDVFIPGMAWDHSFDWNPPEVFEERAGGLVYMNSRRGPMPLHEKPEAPFGLVHIAPTDVPWAGLVNLKQGYGFFSLRLEAAASNLDPSGEFGHKAGTYFYAPSDGDSVYWVRPLLYTWGDYRTNNFLTFLPKGSFFYEKNAYILLRLNEGTTRELDRLLKELRNPLRIF